MADHPRMIIPFRKEDGTIFAYQGRMFGKEPQKYITIILDKECPKIFSLTGWTLLGVFMSWKNSF